MSRSFFFPPSIPWKPTCTEGRREEPSITFKPVVPEVLKAKVSVFVDLFHMNERLKQKAIQQSEERFRFLVESMQDYAIFMLDPEGRVTCGIPAPNGSRVFA